MAILKQEVDRLETLQQQQQETTTTTTTQTTTTTPTTTPKQQQQQQQQQQQGDVKQSKEYQMLLRDLQLLLSHRDEITDMKQLVIKLQENV